MIQDQDPSGSGCTSVDSGRNVISDHGLHFKMWIRQKNIWDGSENTTTAFNVFISEMIPWINLSAVNAGKYMWLMFLNDLI